MPGYDYLLLNKSYKVGVWGAGYIGFSTMANYARRGVAAIAMDVIPEKVEAINRGEIEVAGVQEWLGFDVKHLAHDGLIQATLDHKRLLQPDVLVHFVCIPTEKDGKPYNSYLEDVITKLVDLPKADSEQPPLVIIESTLTPSTTEEVIIPIFESHGKRVGQDVLLGVAPRRDWFVDDTKSLKELDRVFGGFDERTTEAMQAVLGIVCDRLNAASNHRTAEMVKSFENAYRHMEITLANQLSLAYPGEDVREVLRLVGTKWNIGTFYPGFGTGGYCIPISSQYVIAGSEKSDMLTILRETIKSDQAINRLIARSLVSRGLKSVGVLGLSYKANLKVPILSPTIPFVEELLANGVSVKLYDPFYDAQEIHSLAGVPVFSFPEGLREFDAVVAVVDHDVFKQSAGVILKYLEHCEFILDNLGMWRELAGAFAALSIEYHISGDAYWLSDSGGVWV